MRTIVTNHPADEVNPTSWFEIDNKFVVEEKNSLGKEFLDGAFDILASTSVLPSNNSTGFLAARGGGQFVINELRASMGICIMQSDYRAWEL
jgi:hypothetical protein